MTAIALYQGWLQVGYATLYTMAPVFSLVLDKDVNEDLALLYPELYKELTKVSISQIEAVRVGETANNDEGAIIELQDLLHLAHYQCLPR